ncbi:flap endonuclease [Alkalicoccus urumqiensis]|uniref:5'-3' exonuclease n=2 Tax=Alkalicoccus urumqiensis TaxID=1548213 RepID=A0A2P6MKX9_ALKUR|nr:flap endonuclease [Alkalicoccus urumqiensis]
MKKLIVIDGFNLLSRGYFATSYGRPEEELPVNDKGEYINALRVFFAKMNQLERQLGASHISVAWDGKREDTTRNQQHTFYKAQRKDLPKALISQYHTASTVLNNMGIHHTNVTGFEADDIIGAFSKRADENLHVYMYSNDRDLFQLLNLHTDQLFMKKKQEIHYTVDDFKRDYEIEPYQWVDVKALLGDPSDNIPGCPGVGEKAALPLIKQYVTVEELYEKLDELDPLFKRYYKKLAAGEENVKISKELAAIDPEVKEILELDIDELGVSDPELRQEVLEEAGIVKAPFGG